MYIRGKLLNKDRKNDYVVCEMNSNSGQYLKYSDSFGDVAFVVLVNHCQKYQDYLLSDEWKNKRDELMAIRGSVCELCGSTIRLVIHHLSYENIFCEKMEDLQLLCNKCHLGIHKKMKHLAPPDAKMCYFKSR